MQAKRKTSTSNNSIIEVDEVDRAWRHRLQLPKSSSTRQAVSVPKIQSINDAIRYMEKQLEHHKFRKIDDEAKPGYWIKKFLV